MKDPHLYEESLKHFVGVALASIKASLRKIKQGLGNFGTIVQSLT